MRKSDTVLGYLLMDRSATVWYDTAVGIWTAFSTVEDGREVVPFIPPAEAFRQDLPAARKEAAALQELGIDARPTRVAYVCR